MAKIEEAKAVISGCKARNGFHASTQLYPELWVRDLVYSEEALLKLGYGETIKNHLTAFLELQRKNGNIPTVITSLWRRSLNQMFHFWTCDTEILFVIGVLDYASYTGDTEFVGSRRDQIDRCVGFIEGRMDKTGLIPGIDWRDAVIALDGKFLLCNQMQLVTMYERLGHREKSEAIKEKIKEVFLLPDEGHYADSAWWDGGALRRDGHFDAMGSALGVINETISPGSYPSIRDKFMSSCSEFGYRNVAPAYQLNRGAAFRSVRGINAFVRNGAVLRNKKGEYQNSAVWPFVEARVVSALRKMGMESEARRASDSMLRRAGVNEWYCPATGLPQGSDGQLWTAAAIVSQAQ